MTLSSSMVAGVDGRSFLGAFLATAALTAFVIGLSPLFFLRSGENWPYPALVSYQRAHDAIFAPAAPFDYFEYKLEMVRQVRPLLIVLGSSRGLGFQGRYFKVPFVNAAMAMLSLDAGELFLGKLGDHKPRYARGLGLRRKGGQLCPSRSQLARVLLTPSPNLSNS